MRLLRIQHSADRTPSTVDHRVQDILEGVSGAWLRGVVERLSMPRHFVAEPEANRRTKEWLADWFERSGYKVEEQGPWGNLVCSRCREPRVLVGAHYDSVPGSPGADDNASAVAAMLGCARAVAEPRLDLPVAFVAFNREEDNLMGSRDFVASRLSGAGWDLKAVHVLEMVGYCRHEPGSQSVPPGLPIRLRSTGDFLGIVGNRRCQPLIEDTLQAARDYVPDLRVSALRVPMGIERLFPVLLRSDHTPFWQAGIPAAMWTDTSEFRNPHYHARSDRPETLDYEFLASVTRCLIAAVVAPRLHD